ncbi:MAG TPA: zf-HC2 domain-containing protein [Gemmataceae bacterium]|nr:zf-HC2 domain-containing protein [Gemmataceae bacterium]
MKQSDRDRVLALFQLAADVPPPDTGHVADDDELLTAWREGNLTPAEEERFFAHLDACPACRKAVVELAQSLPAPETPAVPEGAKHSGSRRLLWTAAVALAACLVIGIAWALTGSNDPAELARARADLEQGRPEAALERLQNIRPDRLGGDGPRAELAKLREQAAYEAALDDLKAARYDEAARTCRSVREKGVNSARLTNVYLMATADPAERVPGELAMAFHPTLLHRGFRPDGTRPNPVFLPPNPEREAAWRAAVKEHPDDEFLIMNLGDFLLNRGRYHEAGEVFSQRDLVGGLPARGASEPGLTRADGRALANFGDGQNPPDVEWALTCFRIGDRFPTNAPALVNCAVCLERLGKPAEARPYWEKALPLVTDPAIKAQIEQNLAKK